MATDADIEASVFSQLASTRYACSSITRLNGGTANFVYRGILSNPESIGAEDGKASIIIKHTKDFVALNRDFKLDGERCVFEALVLKGLNTFSPVRDTSVSPPITVKTPRLYDFNAATHTQAMEDLPGSSDLKTWLLSPDTGMRVDEPAAKAIGHALGSWLGSFHTWTTLDAQVDLRQKLAENKSMQQLKFIINYNTLISTIDEYPEILENSRSVFEKVRAHAAEEISTHSTQNASSENEGWGPIHGDFWTGNVLIDHEQHSLFVIDWEMSQLGMRALDLGQVLAELYEVKHFKNNEAGIWIMEGLMEKYPLLNEAQAFRIAMHMGVHLVCWSGTAGGSWGSESQIEDAVRIGRDLIVKGWERDRGWFEEDGTLRVLFR